MTHSFRFFFLAFSGILFLASAHAQQTGFGLKGGLNVSAVGGNDAQVGSAKASFHVGAYFSKSLSDKVSFQPELVYSRQGYQYTGYNAYVINFDYLSLPLLAKIYPSQSGFNIQLGPQLGYLLSAKDEFGVTAYELKKFDYGLALGISYEFISGLNVAGRYYLGLANLQANSASNTLNFTNRVFQVSIGYTFRGKE